MESTVARREAIRAFADRYRYDMSYQLDLLEGAPEAFEVFARAQGTSGHRRVLSPEVHHVARVAMMLAEGCRDCVEINLRMALEDGVERGLLEVLLERPGTLPADLKDVRDHAFAVAGGPGLDPERTARLRANLGAGGWAELAVCLAGCRLFTTAKRSLDRAGTGDVTGFDLERL